MLSNTVKRMISLSLAETTHISNWRITGPKRRARKCILYLARSPDSSMIVAIKRYRPDYSGAAGPQYAALERYAPLMNISGVNRVPTPFDFLEKDNVVLMEWVKAYTLHHCLWLHWFDRNTQKQLMFQAMVWLRRFHKYSKSLQPCRTSRYGGLLMNVMDRHNGIKCLKLPDFSVAFTAFCELRDQLDGTMQRHAIAHGDFTPSNILLSSRQVTGIDLRARYRLPVADDVARMLAYLLTGYPASIKEEYPLNRAVIRFALKAYGYAGDERFLLFVLLYQSLRRWVIMQHRAHLFSSVDRWRLHRTKRLVNAIVAELKATRGIDYMLRAPSGESMLL